MISIAQIKTKVGSFVENLRNTVPKCFAADVSARDNDPERFKTAGYAVFQANLVLHQIVAGE